MSDAVASARGPEAEAAKAAADDASTFGSWALSTAGYEGASPGAREGGPATFGEAKSTLESALTYAGRTPYSTTPSVSYVTSHEPSACTAVTTAVYQRSTNLLRGRFAFGIEAAYLARTCLPTCSWPVGGALEADPSAPANAAASAATIASGAGFGRADVGSRALKALPPTTTPTLPLAGEGAPAAAPLAAGAPPAAAPDPSSDWLCMISSQS